MGMEVRIHGLRARRGTFVLDVAELTIRDTETFAVLGSSGAGKTVLVESIAGAFPLDEGTIEFNGQDGRELPVQDRSVGIVYQDCLLFPHMTVLDNVAYGPLRRGSRRSPARARAMELLELFGVAHLAASAPALLSGGEQQRVALARALATRPELLLLDEPFSALDPTTRQGLHASLRRARADFDCTVVLVTHDFHEAQSLADRVGIIMGGRLRTVVRAQDLFASRHDPELARFLGIPETEEGGMP